MKVFRSIGSLCRLRTVTL